MSFQEFSDQVNVVRRARNERKAKSRWLTLAKSVGKNYDEELEDLDEKELQRRVEESERVERAMQRNFALREQADRDDGMEVWARAKVEGLKFAFSHSPIPHSFFDE